MRPVEIYFIAEVKKNGVWVSTGISSTSLPDLNQKLSEYLKHNPAEARIIQKAPKANLRPKKKGCC